MSALGYTTTTEPITGWRCWRVLDFNRLDGSWAYRLCAVGQLGLPKVWEPQRETVAVCSKFSSNHEAPWPEHECGIWALKSPEDARRRLVRFMLTQSQGEETVGWAIGRVNLWGRVIEHEEGWRGQYAYPYELTVTCEADTVARDLRAEYAVDVELMGSELLLATRAKRKQRTAASDEKHRAAVAELKTIRRETSEISRRVRALAKPKEPKPKVEDVLCPPIATDVSREDVLTAFYLHAARALQGGTSRERARWVAERNLVEPGELTLVLLWQRDWPLARLAWSNRKKLPSHASDALRSIGNAVPAELRRMKRDGLVESGMISLNYRQVYYRLTEKGIDAVAGAGLPSRLRTVHEDGPGWDVRPLVVKTVRISRSKALERLRLRPSLFTTEVDALKPHLAAKRATARAKGGLSFKHHLARVRGRDEFGEVRIYWTEDEVYSALRQAFRMRRRQPVSFQQLMAVLGPGKYGKEEAARVSAVLVKLRKARKVEREEHAGNPKLWRPTRA